MSDFPEDYEQENWEQMGPVATGASVAVSVELGRFESSNRELMSFHVGQVVELHRSPYEPVDLVVDGQKFGQGELVEINGQMGVRVVKLYE